jgi:hypothetical protein
MYAEHRFMPDLAQQHYVEGLLSHLEWSAATPRVLAIGRDAIHDADHYVEAYGFSRLQIDGIDLDYGSQRQPTTLSADADSGWLPSALEQVMARPAYHLIWAGDLFDGVDSYQGQRILHQLLRAVAPGGEVVIGSYRSAHQLHTLAACDVPAVAMTLRRGPDGMKLFLHIKVRRTPSGIAAPVIHLN